jgi:hypothetical protein
MEDLTKMFAKHQPQISAFARRSPDNFRRVVVFALCTIRMPFRTAASDVALACDNKPCRSIFGAKIAGLASIDEPHWLYEQCERAWACSDHVEDELVHIFQSAPSLGPAKAGFCTQMIYGVSGCLDTHNLVRFGLNPREFRGAEGKYKPATVCAKISAYNDVCRKLGGTAYLWDSWCEYVAERGTAGTYSAEAISALHLAPLNG